jgi:hypothetical protein
MQSMSENDFEFFASTGVTSGGQSFNVALGMELRLLPFGWQGSHVRGQRVATVTLPQMSRIA